MQLQPGRLVPGGGSAYGLLPATMTRHLVQYIKDNKRERLPLRGLSIVEEPGADIGPDSIWNQYWPIVENFYSVGSVGQCVFSCLAGEFSGGGPLQ